MNPMLPRRILAAAVLVSLLLLVAGKSRATPILLSNDSSPTAASTLILSDGVDHYPLGRYVEFLEDNSGTLTIDAITSPAMAARFVRNDKAIPNFGLGDTVYWLRFRVSDHSPAPRDWLLEQQFPLMRTFDLYTPDNSGAFTVTRFSGNSPDQKALLHRNPLFPLLLPKKADTFYARVSVGSLVVFPLVVHARDAFMKQDAAILLCYGLYFGIMLAMALYNFYLFAFIRDRVYLYYVLYVVFFVCLQMSLHGFLRQYLFPGNPALDNHLMRFFIVAAAVSSLAFSREFLKPDRYVAVMDRCLRALIAFDILLIPIDFFLPVLTSLVITDLNTLIAPLLAGATGIICYVRGFKPARYYLVARACLYVSVCAFVLDNTMARNHTFFSWYGMMPASLLDVALLSLGLADRIRIMRLEREQARLAEETAIAEERRRIARDIHDGVAQDLAMMSMRASVWEHLVHTDRERMTEEIGLFRTLLKKNIGEVRRAIFALRPLELDELGFVKAMERYVRHFGHYTGLRIALEMTGAESMPRPLETELCRIVQETLNNIAKHARATEVRVGMQATSDGWLALTVTDNGQGFDPAGLEQTPRLGLRQMRERVEGRNGSLAIDSAPGRGASITVRFPLIADASLSP